MKNVVVIGGGTGTYVVLSSLRDKPYSLTALLTMADDGGSNKVLRDEFGLLPTSGVRLAIVALSKKQSLLRELFTYRFNRGAGISGMTFGNLFLAAVSDIVGSQEKAIEQTCELLSVKGKIIPISYDDVRLVAQLENDQEVVGEHEIDEPSNHDGKLRIKKLYTKPSAIINPAALDHLMSADAIILGPGDFYTNTIANLVVGGVSNAIIKSKGKLIFIVNLMTDYGESYNYKASDYFQDLKQYLPLDRIDFVIVNNDTKLPKEAIEQYNKENSIPVEDDLDSILPSNTKIIRESVLSRKIWEAQKGDVIKRGIIRHNSKKLAKVLEEVIGT